MEERAVNEGVHDPLPDVAMTYYPDTDMIIIQAGKPAVSPIHESESIANYMVAHCDDNRGLVALDLDSVDLALKPFVDAVLKKEQEKAAQAG